jgi:hypothetical protein
MAVKDATVKHIQHKEDVNERTAGHIFDAGVQQGIETQREAHQTQLAGQNQQFQLALSAQQEAAHERLAVAQMNNALKAAGISATAPLAAKLDYLRTMGAADPKSPLYQGYMLTEQASKEPHMYESYAKLSSDMATGPDFLKRFPTFEAYKAGMAGTGGGGTMSAAGWGQAVKH